MKTWRAFWGTASLFSALVGRFLGDLHIVHVGFAHTRRSDLDELCLGAHFFDGGAAAIAHGGAYAADQLIDDGDDAALVRPTALNNFGHELVDVVGRNLKIAKIGRELCRGRGGRLMW